MLDDRQRTAFRTVARTIRPKSPLSILSIAGLSWLLRTNGYEFHDVFTRSPDLWNVVAHLAAMVFHDGMAHLTSNLQLLVPFGILLTLLTRDEHVLVVVIVSQLLGSLLYVATMGGWGVGSSLALSAVFAATLVRAIGIGMQNASAAWLQTIVGGTLVPFNMTLFVVVLFSGPDDIAHFAHFYGFLLGGAIEAIYVFAEHEPG